MATSDQRCVKFVAYRNGNDPHSTPDHGLSGVPGWGFRLGAEVPAALALATSAFNQAE